VRALTLLPLILLTLTACSQRNGTQSGDDKFAGFQAELDAWRTAIEAESPVCSVKTDGKGCQDFAVACKRERPVTAEEQARGVTAKLVAAITFQSRTAEAKPGSAFAEFARANGAWTRRPTEAVNLTTCEAAPHAGA
jgi:hypothetical protein